MSNQPSRPSPPPAPPTPRRALPWALLPLLLALVYAGVRGVIGRDASLESMVPADAVLVWRWKDLATYDAQRSEPASGGENWAAPSAVLGAESNLPALAGVDRARPIVEALLPDEGRIEPRLVVLPIADASTMLATFRRPDLPERHARHLELHGAWAASCSDRRVARDAGTYRSPLPPYEGEDWCVTANWPAFVDFVLHPDQAAQEPFAGVLATLGFEMNAAVKIDDRSFSVKAGRVPIVRDAWARVTLRSSPGRIVVDLDPADDAKELRSVLAAVRPDPTDDREAAMPSPVDASLHVRGAAGRRALVYVLGYAGVDWPTAAAADEFKALALGAPGGLTAWAEVATGPSPTWVVSLAAPRSAFPALEALGRTDVSAAGEARYAAGAARLTAIYGGTPEPTTFRPVPTAAEPDVWITAIGSRADVVRAKAAATTTLHARTSPPDTPDRIEVATFSLAKTALQRLLGSAALGPRGLFAALEGGDVRGRLLVLGRGARVRIELEVEARTR